MTFLEVTNRVLKRLRESVVASVSSTTYSALIGDFVADIQDEMIERHAWAEHYITATATLADGQSTYDLSASISNQSELAENDLGGPNVFYYESGKNIGDCIDVYNEQDYNRIIAYNDSTKTGRPYYTTYVPSSSAGGMQQLVFPTPAADQACDRILSEFYVPPARLSADADVVSVPDRALYLGALYLALNERGEEIGEPGNIAERRWEDALGAAIEADKKLRQKTNRYEAARH